MLSREIPELMKLIQKEEAQASVKAKTEAPIKGVGKLFIFHLSPVIYHSHQLFIKLRTISNYKQLMGDTHFLNLKSSKSLKKFFKKFQKNF